MHPADNLSSLRQKEAAAATTTTKTTTTMTMERREKEERTLQKLSYAHSPTATLKPEPTQSDLQRSPKIEFGLRNSEREAIKTTTQMMFDRSTLRNSFERGIHLTTTTAANNFRPRPVVCSLVGDLARS